jgi:S-adenosylmethionine decarboxylase
MNELETSLSALSVCSDENNDSFDDGSTLEHSIISERSRTDDITLEIMMTHLDRDAMKNFWKKESDDDSDTPNRISVQTGIVDIYPGSVIDDFIFDPCGYSMNGMLNQYYWTIHVTPEDHCSYASFETSVSADTKDFGRVIEKVVGIFKPASFSVTVFTNHAQKTIARHDTTSIMRSSPLNTDTYKMKDYIVHGLANWDVSFMHFDMKSHVKKLEL